MAARWDPADLERWAAGPNFSVRYRGYDREEVDDFVVESLRAIRRLQDRVDELEEWLQKSEEDSVRERFRAVKAEHRRVAAEERAEQAERVQREMQDSLDLANRTRRAMISVAKEQVEGVYATAMKKARAEAAAEQRRLIEEADKLDALRLAVAAERMALDEVRADIRTRIGAAAAELNRIADSDYFLGTSKAEDHRDDEPDPGMVEALREMVNAQAKSDEK